MCKFARRNKGADHRRSSMLGMLSLRTRNGFYLRRSVADLRVYNGAPECLGLKFGNCNDGMKFGAESTPPRQISPSSL